MDEDEDIATILAFWFGNTVRDASQIPGRMSLWFSSNKATDNEIALRFASSVEQARSGALDSWRQKPDGRLATVLLLDQFPRNLYRGKPGAFASDAAALEICQQSIVDKTLLALAPIEQVFVLMPLQHAECRDLQRRSVEEFSKLGVRVQPSERHYFEGFIKYAQLHKKIIDRFGRFPHRNAILGRTSTQEESAYLAGDAPRFGQR